MIEAYAFLAAFTVQILVMSVLLPAWFIRYVRVQMTSIPAERLAQLYPGVDLSQAQERFLTQYRALAMGHRLGGGSGAFRGCDDEFRGGDVDISGNTFIVAQPYSEDFASHARIFEGVTGVPTPGRHNLHCARPIHWLPELHE